MKRALIIYGAPGAGKGTQAELFTRKFGFVHFDTGRYIEALAHSEEAAKNPVLRRERDNFDSGRLCTPSWVLNIITSATRKIAGSGESIVFSGSPRTLYEAFGITENSGKQTKAKGLIEELARLYGKKNVFVVYLTIDEKTSIKRNSARFVCSVCGLPVLSKSKVKECGLCGAPPKKRTLDNPKTIKVRLEEYKNRTLPIIEIMEKRGFRVLKIDGSPAPYKVFEKIENKIIA